MVSRKILFLVFVIGIIFPFVSSADPEVFLNFPENNSYVSSDPVEFNCTFFDADGPSGNLSLWGNFSGSWVEDQRYEVSDGDLTHVFTKSLPEGEYFWTCVSEDNTSISTFGENRTLTVDLTAPIVDKIYFNESYSCGNKSIKITCNTSDNYWVEEVFLQVDSPSSLYNKSMSFSSGTNYSSFVFVNETGDWEFSCYSRDNASNYGFFGPEIFVGYSGYPELYVNESKISFNNTEPIEGEVVNVSGVVENIGCVDATNFNVSFFKDSIFWSNQIGTNQTISLSKFSEFLVHVTYNSFIGKNNIFLFADSSLNIFESVESDNEGNNSFFVTLWQDFYGNVSAVKVLKGTENFTAWSLKEQVVGNVFATDIESEINWFSLQALGKNLSGSETLDDFSDVDTLLGTTDFNDSVYNKYLDEGQIRYKKNFVVNQREIFDVAVINSTNNENFVTGILWDSSDDTNGEFDISDKEDLIFVTEINEDSVGEYGVYDYEITVPVELRNYDSQDVSDIYLYYNLI